MDTITIARQIWRRVLFATVRTDASTGLLYYRRAGQRIFIRRRHDYVLESDWLYVCERVFFRHYLPAPGETMVDIGAGFGEEALYLPPGVRYVGVEIQPTVYEHLANTLRERLNSSAVPFAISDGPMAIESAANYLGVEARSGYIEIPTLTWGDFLSRYRIGRIDLLKVNIEGGELDFLKSVDLLPIRHIIVSTHDFRANRGEGEHFRTASAVKALLAERGFRVEKATENGPDWADTWYFATSLAA